MHVDPDLMALVQHSSARQSLSVVDAFRAIDPGDPATSREFGSGALVSWGKGRYVNRAIGASLDELGPAELDELVAFFDEAGVPPSIEVCSWATTELVEHLVARQFVPIRFVDLLTVGSDESNATMSSATSRMVDMGSRDAWTDAFVGGFAGSAEEERLNRELARVLPHVPSAVHLLADIDGRVAGCGSLYPQGVIGWVGGGATLPSHRRRGVQGALLAARIALARDLGCEIVAGTATSASPSSRNMQRLGFNLVATIVVMTRG